MLKKLIPLLLVTLLFISCDEDNNNNPVIPTADTHLLYVINGFGSTISIINLDEGTVENDAYLVGAFPTDIQYKNNKLYVVNSGDNTIQIIDLTSGNSDLIEIGDGHNPTHLELYGDNLGAVTNYLSGSVSFLDFSTNTVTDEISVGAGIWGSTYLNGKLYIGIINFDPISFVYGQGYAAVIDAQAHTLLDSISVGKNPGILFVDSQGELNVVCTGDYFNVEGEVYRCNMSDNSIIGSYAIGGSPSYEVVASDGTVYLGAGGWVDEGYVLSYDSNTETVIHSGTDPLTFSGESGIQGMTVDSEGNLYACAFNSDHVIKFSSEGIVLDTYAVGDAPQTLVYVEY